MTEDLGGRVISFLGADVEDTGAVAAFFEGLFGWKFSEPAGEYPRGTLVTTDLPVLTGLRPSAGSGGFVPSFEVRDVEAAATRVRRLGGTAGDPEDKAHGRVARCEYGGLTFYVGQPPIA